MDLGLKNRVVVVTGGTSGIGYECVKILLEDGAKVAFCGRDSARLEQALRRLTQNFNSDNILAHICDVLDDKQIVGFAQKVEDKFGCTHALINNAGGGRVSTFKTTGDNSWREELDLKMFSVIYPVRAFQSMLERAQDASITVTNSLLAKQPEPHMVCTSAARAAQLNMVRSLASEFAPMGIRVNSILLGTIASGQWEHRYKKQASAGQSYEDWLAGLAQKKNIPLERFGQPEEAARVLVFLASPAASYITGTAIDVSGGMARSF